MEINQIFLQEEDVIKTVLEFLSSRNYHVAMRMLEKESCVLNCNYPQEILFLRELVLDGDFTEVLQLGDSFASRMKFDVKYFKYIALRQKFIELIYTKSHILEKQSCQSVEEVMKTLSLLETCCPAKEDYSNLCWLLTVPNLQAQEEFKNWTLDISRLKCFEDLLCCIDKTLPSKSSDNIAGKDRLLKLIVKGFLYEMCTDYCQSIASGQQTGLNCERDILHNDLFDHSPANLLCWILSLPFEVFRRPFEQVNIDILYSGLKNADPVNLVTGCFYENKKKRQETNVNNFPDNISQTNFPENDSHRNDIQSSPNVKPSLSKCANPVSEQVPLTSEMISSMEPVTPVTRSSNEDERIANEPVVNDNKMEIDQRTELSDKNLVVDDALSKKNKKGFEIFDETSSSTREAENKRRAKLLEKLKDLEESRQRSRSKLLEGSKTSKSDANKVSSSITDQKPPFSNHKVSGPNATHASHFVQDKDEVNGKVDKLTGENVLVDKNISEATSDVLSGGNQMEGKENAHRQGDVVMGPVINGVRRPIAPSYLESMKNKGVEMPTPKETAEHVGVNVVPELKGAGPRIKTKGGTTVHLKELIKNKEVKENTVLSASKLSNHVEEAGYLSLQDEIVKYAAVEMLEDVQAVRSVSFHPNGNLFAVGANSKILRICKVRENHNEARDVTGSMQVVFKRPKFHRGSIYTMAWHPNGNLLATGSNDKTIKVINFDTQNYVQINNDLELNIHNGTIREVTFAPNKDGLLLSGGAGDGSVNITDVAHQKLVGSLDGHTGNVLTVYAGENQLVATGGTDNTLRLWDLRSERCIDVVMVGESSPASVALSSDYLASGQEDGSILLYDITAGRTLQNFRLHQSDCRSVRFSHDNKYLLTSSYDATISLMHLTGNLDKVMPKHYTVARHDDKVIQCRWHSNMNMFLSSSADRTAVLWKAVV